MPAEQLEDRLLLDARLVADINQTPLARDSFPQDFVELGDSVLFSAQTLDGRGLWRTDGTAAGTQQIAGLEPGPASAVFSDLRVFDEYVYFQYTVENGPGRIRNELWRSDGTEDGTFLVKDIRGGTAGSAPIDLYDFNDRLFFTADDGLSGPELWSSDGTVAGTALVQDIAPGLDSADIGEMWNIDDTLYFSASDGENGTELWTSDRTTDGTRLAPHNVNSDSVSTMYDSLRTGANIRKKIIPGARRGGDAPRISDHLEIDTLMTDLFHVVRAARVDALFSSNNPPRSMD